MNCDESREYIKIELCQLVRYAHASYDFNPIHTNKDQANKIGLHNVIAHGMYIMGIAAIELTKRFGINHIKEFSARFTSMTFPGEKIKTICTIEKNSLSGEIKVININEEIKLIGTFNLK
ncbi:hypothetical protein DSCW_05190 [Desulfosarcina widdelii]|uniref:MaoC-like domain-containing protein n=1 Tax=Desulfosarcina widdelii TaxID=947919 RepID=A0A5K7YTD5_9BACT|nr:MaoC/PaaZ C-terminal domain-containing protein [Desulfosarcina widdelii]BBO73102.1 hypothetical protein DSCW_05190 [Desulfosarcina widdelii]